MCSSYDLSTLELQLFVISFLSHILSLVLTLKSCRVVPAKNLTRKQQTFDPNGWMFSSFQITSSWELFTTSPFPLAGFPKKKTVDYLFLRLSGRCCCSGTSLPRSSMWEQSYVLRRMLELRACEGFWSLFTSHRGSVTSPLPSKSTLKAHIPTMNAGER